MTVFDFDKTVFRTDSTVAFWKYCVRRKKRLLFLLPKQLFYGGLYALRILDLTAFKAKFFCFLKHIDAEAYAADFWRDHASGIMPWAKAAIAPGDWVVSASPEFLLRPIAASLGLRLLATRMDPKSGKITGKNCKGEEKTARLAAVGVTHWERAYSDSRSDAPLFSRADEAFLVDNKKGTVLPFRP